MKERKNESRENLEILLEIIQTVSENFDLKEIMDNIVKIIVRREKPDSCFIYLLSGREVILKASNKSNVREIKMKIGEGITGWVAETKRSVVIEKKAYEDKRFKLFNNLPEDTFEAFISIPIIFRKKVIGVINLQYKKPYKLAKKDREFLEFIGKQIGGILEVSRLVSETNMLKEALETQKQMGKAKAILMKSLRISEENAHRLLVKKSMDKRKTLKEVSEAIILADEIAE